MFWLMVSTTNSIALKVLVPRMAEVVEACRGADLDLRISDALVDFDTGIDLAIRFGPGGWRGLQSRHLANEVLFPVVSPDYRNGEFPRTEAELRDHRLIHHPESSWRLWLDAQHADSILAQPGLHIDSAGLVSEAAKSGLGVALGRGRLVQDDVRSGALVRILDRSVPAEYDYWAVWDASSPKQDLIENFVDLAARLLCDE